MGTKSGSWLDCPKYKGTALKIPTGVWIQDPNKYIFDFIEQVDGKLPEDTLDWKVDENKINAFEKLFGPEGMLILRDL